MKAYLCPLCGSKPAFHHASSPVQTWMYCSNCYDGVADDDGLLMQGCSFNSAAEALDSWNRAVERWLDATGEKEPKKVSIRC